MTTTTDTRAPTVTGVTGSEYLTAREVATVAHVSYRTVLRWAGAGLTTYRLNGMLRIRRSDLDTFLDRHRVGSQS